MAHHCWLFQGKPVDCITVSYAQVFVLMLTYLHVSLSVLYVTWPFWPCWSPTLPVQVHETHKLSWMLFASSLEKQGWEQVIKIPSGNTRLKAPNYTSAMDFLSWEKSFVMSILVKCRLRLCKPWPVSSEFRSAVLGTVLYYFSDMLYIHVPQHHSLFTGQGGS